MYPKIHLQASYPSSSSFSPSFFQGSSKNGHLQMQLRCCQLMSGGGLKRYQGGMYFEEVRHGHLLGQVRASHLCAHQLKREARGGAVIIQGKNRVVSLIFDVKCEVEHHQMGL